MFFLFALMTAALGGLLTRYRRSTYTLFVITLFLLLWALIPHMHGFNMSL